MLGTLVTWFIGGAMLCVWIAWLLCLIGVGRVLEWRRGPHGEPCVCAGCMRVREHLARIPTPRPLPRTHFATARAWSVYDEARKDLIRRKQHYGFAPHLVDPWPPVPDPEPVWWPSEQARVRRRSQATFARNMARHRRLAAERALYLKQLKGEKLTRAELESLWPRMLH